MFDLIFEKCDSPRIRCAHRSEGGCAHAPFRQSPRGVGRVRIVSNSLVDFDTLRGIVTELRENSVNLLLNRSLSTDTSEF